MSLDATIYADTERRNSRGLRCNTAEQQAVRRLTAAQKAERREKRIAEGIANDKALIESHRRMTQLKTLCAKAGIPWYVRMDATAEELEALLMDAAADTEAAAVADDRAEMRASLRQF